MADQQKPKIRCTSCSKPISATEPYIVSHIHGEAFHFTSACIKNIRQDCGITPGDDHRCCRCGAWLEMAEIAILHNRSCGGGGEVEMHQTCVADCLANGGLTAEEQGGGKKEADREEINT